MENNSKSKYALVAVVVLILIALVYWVSLNKTNITKNPPVEGQFFGTLDSVEGNKLKLHGVFTNPATLVSDLPGERDFSFNIAGSTKLTKLSIQMPTVESLEASGNTTGAFRLEDMPKTETASSLDDIRTMSAITGATVENQGPLNPDPVFYVKFTLSGSDLSNITASSVTYQLLIDPSQQ